MLVGDFNATLDQSQFRDLLDRGYRDAGAVAGEGLEPTFPRLGHLIPPITIDHVLADRRLGIVEYSVEEMPGSDHRPVHAELVAALGAQQLAGRPSGRSSRCRGRRARPASSEPVTVVTPPVPTSFASMIRGETPVLVITTLRSRPSR